MTKETDSVINDIIAVLNGSNLTKFEMYQVLKYLKKLVVNDKI